MSNTFLYNDHLKACNNHETCKFMKYYSEINTKFFEQFFDWKTVIVGEYQMITFKDVTIKRSYTDCICLKCSDMCCDIFKFNGNNCMHIMKSGPSKGQSCQDKATGNYYWCDTHTAQRLKNNVAMIEEQDITDKINYAKANCDHDCTCHYIEPDEKLIIKELDFDGYNIVDNTYLHTYDHNNNQMYIFKNPDKTLKFYSSYECKEKSGFDMPHGMI